MLAGGPQWHLLAPALPRVTPRGDAPRYSCRHRSQLCPCQRTNRRPEEFQQSQVLTPLHAMCCGLAVNGQSELRRVSRPTIAGLLPCALERWTKNLLLGQIPDGDEAFVQPLIRCIPLVASWSRRPSRPPSARRAVEAIHTAGVVWTLLASPTPACYTSDFSDTGDSAAPRPSTLALLGPATPRPSPTDTWGGWSLCRLGRRWARGSTCWRVTGVGVLGGSRWRASRGVCVGLRRLRTPAAACCAWCNAPLLPRLPLAPQRSTLPTL